MDAIITDRNADGTYDEVGMRNRSVATGYSTTTGLLRHGIPRGFGQHGSVRVEIFNDIHDLKPYKVIYS